MIADLDQSTAPRFPLPVAPPPDLRNLAYLEDMRSRLGELAQIARAAVPTAAPAATLAAHMRLIDHADAVHDCLIGLSLRERGLI